MSIEADPSQSVLKLTKKRDVSNITNCRAVNEYIENKSNVGIRRNFLTARSRAIRGESAQGFSTISRT